MADCSITLGNKNYSSWSLRGWLVLERCGIPFDEEVIPLRQADTRERILARSPSGKVPTLRLRDGQDEIVVWDSLAIAEALAERYPAARLWPVDAAARTRARAVSAEMHAGFAALRRWLPMDMRSKREEEGRLLRQADGVEADIARVTEIWQSCRQDFGLPAGGDYLFGAFSAADAAYLPVASRFQTYGIALEGAAAAYAEALLAWPALEPWLRDAGAEPWVIDFPELEPALRTR